jgi:hypothetical protein
MSFSLSLMIGHRPPDRRQTEVCRISKAPSPLRSAGALQICLICFSLLFQPVAVLAQRRTVTITIDTSHATNRIVPSRALGAAIDGHEKGVNDLQLTSPNIQAMLSAGFKPLTYRLRTELAGDVWHWNPAGAWSDAQNREGYWTSDAKLGDPIALSYGYSLPRRGNTIDQATNNGYSRIDDGDAETFWKSNPYLDRRFTGEDNSLHPQWIVIDFERPVPINEIRILWGQPFAETFRIQYGNFDDVSDIALNAPGTWKDFPRAFFTGGAPPASNQPRPLRLSPNPIKARWVRIFMTESSSTNAEITNDIRDRLGFAVRELSAGVVDAQRNFHDRMRHGTTRQKQTIVYVSSTDPWHRDSDLHQDVEQVGLDRIYATGLTNNLPMLLPTGLLYDTPENAANEIRYLRARGYKFDRVELGEEPDGQYVTPEDFGALYLQWTEAIHQVDPTVQLGGPSFQEISIDEDASKANRGNGEWMRRFLDYLKRRGRSSDYSFFSFEWYPFDDVCEPTAPQLAQAPKLLDDALKEMQRRGVPHNIPWIISEYGYSAFAARAEIDIEGALLNADIVGKFLTLGGDQAFLFGYTPSEILREVPCTAGNNMLFLMDENGHTTHRFATYFGARLLTQEWLQPGNEAHEIYPASSDVHAANGNALVTAYAVHRPDGLWSVMLINKDPKRAFPVTLIIKSTDKSTDRSQKRFEGVVDVYQYSPRQYALGGSSSNPYPIKADEPEHRVTDASSPVSLPPYSLTVIRGKLSR